MTFLYIAIFDALGGALFLFLSFAPLSRSPSPRTARKFFRITSAFMFAGAVLFGVLSLFQRFAWFADTPWIGVLLLLTVAAAMAIVLWLYYRAVRPLAQELQRAPPKSMPPN